MTESSLNGALGRFPGSAPARNASLPVLEIVNAHTCQLSIHLPRHQARCAAREIDFDRCVQLGRSELAKLGWNFQSFDPMTLSGTKAKRRSIGLSRRVEQPVNGSAFVEQRNDLHD